MLVAGCVTRLCRGNFFFFFFGGVGGGQHWNCLVKGYSYLTVRARGKILHVISPHSQKKVRKFCLLDHLQIQAKSFRECLKRSAHTYLCEARLHSRSSYLLIPSHNLTRNCVSAVCLKEFVTIYLQAEPASSGKFLHLRQTLPYLLI